MRHAFIQHGTMIQLETGRNIAAQAIIQALLLHKMSDKNKFTKQYVNFLIIK